MEEEKQMTWVAEEVSKRSRRRRRCRRSKMGTRRQEE